jgi:hypothetical protein
MVITVPAIKTHLLNLHVSIRLPANVLYVDYIKRRCAYCSVIIVALATIALGELS